MKSLPLALSLSLALASTTGLPGLAAEPPSASHAQAATELLGLMNLEATMIGSAEATADLMIQQNAVLAPFREVLLKWAGTFLTWETFKPRFTDLYIESFSEAEMRDLILFYKTPTGRKSLELLPELTRRGMEIGAAVAQEHTSELEQMIEERATQLEAASPAGSTAAPSAPVGAGQDGAPARP